jgi:3-oxoacyl-[acyl-carrier-protein] synthase-3
MRHISISNIKIEGISAAVPKNKLVNENPRLRNMIGINERRVTNESTFTSDLCYAAAEDIIKKLDIDKNDIGVMVFVSQTPDYKLPITSAILQDKLNLPQECICFDVPLGCSGYTYGLYILSSLIKSSNSKYGILLSGDTISKEVNPKDNSTFPLFGDAGTATILKYDLEFKNSIIFNLGTDGSGYNSIIIPHGGSKFPISDESFIEFQDENGNIRRKYDLYLNGGEVFDFGTNKISKILKQFIEENLSEVDCLILHQANKFMNDRITKKVGVPLEKSLSSLANFGNTSSATIPLTLVTQLSTINTFKNIVFCGFGVGLSWASAIIHQENIYCADLIEI